MKTINDWPVGQWLAKLEVGLFWVGALALVAVLPQGLANPLTAKAAVYAALAAGMAALAAAKFWWREPLRLPALWAGRTLLLAALAVTLSFFASPLRAGLEAGWNGWLLSLLALAVLFGWLKEPANQRHLALAVAACAGLASAWALIQCLGLAQTGALALNREAFGARPFAGFGNPNFLAGFLVLALPVVVWLAAGRRGRAARLGLGAVAAAALAAVICTASKAAMLGLAAEAAVAAHWLWHAPGGEGRRRLKMLGAALAAAAVLAVALPQPRQRLAEFASGRSDSMRFRAHTWGAALSMAKDAPLLGQGPFAFRHRYPAHRATDAMAGAVQHEYEVTHAECWPLQLLADLGLLGLAAVLALLAVWLGPSARACLRDPASDADGLERAALTALAGCLAANLAALDLFLPSTAFFALALAALVAARRHKCYEMRIRPEVYASLMLSAGIFVFWGFVASQAMNLPKASRLLLAAEDLSREGRHEQAQVLYNRSLNHDASEPEAWYFLGQSRLDSGEPTGVTAAAEAFEACARLSPDFALLNYQRGRAAQAMGRLDEAQAFFERQTLIDPNYFGAWQALAELQVRQKRWAEAHQSLTRAAQIFPERADIRHNIQLLENLK